MTALSKTNVECDCGYLERAAKNPNNPIEFKAATNEFNIVHGGSEFRIYHCPFCGGKAPHSVRDSLFAQVSDDEQARLFNLAENLKTEIDLVAVLGSPKGDNPVGAVVGKPLVNGQTPEATAYRVVTYSELSPVAELRLHLHPDGRVASVNVGAKYIGPPRDAT